MIFTEETSITVLMCACNRATTELVMSNSYLDRAASRATYGPSTEFGEKSRKSRQCVFMLSEQLLAGNVTKSKINGPIFSFYVFV